ncbi:MAG TPA: 2OG-Fe(II) oxygenase [Sphingomicrobium sp.]|jgi:prolyl 4-hydroxylase
MQAPVPPLTQAYALFQAGRVPEALEIIHHHAAAGDADALFTLGDMYWRGIGVPQDLVQAYELFGKSSDGGQAMGVRAYTNLMSNGAMGWRDWAKALHRLSEEARSDRLRAWMLQLITAMNLDPSGDPLRLGSGERLSDAPDVTIFRQGFTAEECDFLIAIAEPTYEESRVISTDGDIRTLLRTSDGSTMHWLIEDPATHALNRRLAAFTGTNVDQGEPLHILRYRPGQEYKPHVDWLLDDNPRVLTALVYLNEDYAGGETEFIQTGLKVRGRKGDVLVFRSQSSDGGLDPLSEHAGLPVIRGTKYLASRWIRAGKHIDKSRV